MATHHTLQILQKNTLASLQSLIDFTNATLATPGVPNPTLVPEVPTPAEDSLTLTQLRPLLQKLYTLDPITFNALYMFIYNANKGDNLLQKLLPTFLEIQNFEEKGKESAKEMTEEKPVEPKDPEDENDDLEITPIYTRTADYFRMSETLTDDQKRYHSLICGQNWKALAAEFMKSVAESFLPLAGNMPLYHNRLMHTVGVPDMYVETKEDYMFLVRCMIESRSIFGNILLPDTHIIWGTLPAEFVKECKEYYKRNMLFQPATLRYDILGDALKIYHYCKYPKYHKSWRSEALPILRGITDSSIQDLISDWMQECTISEAMREYIITAIIISNFEKKDTSPAPETFWVGSNQFSQTFIEVSKEETHLPSGFVAWATSGITFKLMKKVLKQLGIQQVRRAEGQRYQGIQRLNLTGVTKNILECYGKPMIEGYAPGAAFSEITDDRNLLLMGEQASGFTSGLYCGMEKQTARIAQPFPIDTSTMTDSVTSKKITYPFIDPPANTMPILQEDDEMTFDKMMNTFVTRKQKTAFAFQGFEWEKNIKEFQEKDIEIGKIINEHDKKYKESMNEWENNVKEFKEKLNGPNTVGQSLYPENHPIHPQNPKNQSDVVPPRLVSLKPDA